MREVRGGGEKESVWKEWAAVVHVAVWKTSLRKWLSDKYLKGYEKRV